MKSALKQLNKRPIAYYPVYRDITGSTTAGILLSQLMYWFDKKDKIFKSDAEIIEEIGLTVNELRSAKKSIKKLDFIAVSIEGVPAKTYYEIDWKMYQTSLVNFTKLDELNPRNSVSEYHETNKNNNFNTETTTETTTDIKKDKKEIIEPEIIDETTSFYDKELFAEYLDFRKTVKAPTTAKVIMRLENKLQAFMTKGFNPDEIISNALTNGWKDFYEPKAQFNKPQNNTNVDFALENNIWDLMDQQPQAGQAVLND